MSDELRFVDTNVLVYAFDDDSPTKRDLARELLERDAPHLVLSAQVLGEFYVTVTRKLARPLDPVAASAVVDDLRRLPVKPLTGELVAMATRRSRSAMISYWDALIVETALASGAACVLTEDLQHGQDIDGLEVRNPFV